MTPLTRLVTAACALVALAAAVPAAHADSISYIKDGNVWLTTSDGARQYQVTSEGGYSYASQADDGTLIALHGRRIRRLDRVTGAVQADFATPVSDSPTGASFDFIGPIDPVISPDGTRIAYGYNAHYTRFDPYCGYLYGCREGKLVVGTGYSHSDRLTGWDEPGFKQHSGWQWPSWMDNDHTLITDPAEILNDQFWVDTTGDDKYGLDWFHDDRTNPSSRDAEATRQGTGIAAVEGGTQNERTIHLYKMNGAPPAVPTDCFYINDPGGDRYSSPSWSPDGRAVAFDDGSGVYTMTSIDLDGCDPAKAAAGPVAIAGASKPDWGPADVPAGRPAADAPKPGAGSTPATGARPQQGVVGANGGAKLAVASVKGLTVTVAVPADGTVRAVARKGAKTVASAAARAVKAGQVRLTLKLTKAGRRALRRGKVAKLSVRATFTPRGGGTTQTVATAAKVRR